MRKWRHICLAGLIFLLTACNPFIASDSVDVQVETLPTAAPTKTAQVATATTAPARGIADCPVTQPPEPPFEPSPPYAPSSPGAGQFWYGTDRLWTRVPTSGTWPGLRGNPDGYTQKVFWWREGYSWEHDPTPQLTVTGRRLDAPAPPLKASKATNAFAEDIKSAMLVGVNFPTRGCWEITGKIADQELSFVVWLGP